MDSERQVPKDLIWELKTDHREILDEFDTFLLSRDDEERRRNLAVVRQLLFSHGNSEYLITQRLSQHDELAGQERWRLLKEELDLEEEEFQDLLSEMHSLSLIDSARWRTVFKGVRRRLARHFSKEEKDTFRRMQSLAESAGKTPELLRAYRDARWDIETAA